MRARIPKQGGAQDMNAMIRQAQKMQDKITELQEDIEARDFTASVGGGAVEVVVTGKKNIKSLTSGSGNQRSQRSHCQRGEGHRGGNDQGNRRRFPARSVLIDPWLTTMHCPW